MKFTGKIDYSEVKLIIADMDGTICDDNRKISDYTIEVIKKCQAKGKVFGLASGRDTESLKEFEEKWQLENGFEILIGINGSQLYDGINNTTDMYETLSREQVKEIVLMMEPLDLNPNLMIDENSFLTKRIDNAVQRSLSRLKRNVIVAQDISDYWKYDARKIMFRTTVERMPEVKAWVKAHPSDNYFGFQTDPSNFEFSPGGIDKAYPFRIYCQRHNIDPDKVISFGDMMNDVPLFKACGLGVSMKNGSDEALENADVVTEYDNNEDGFARFIEDHILSVM